MYEGAEVQEDITEGGNYVPYYTEGMSWDDYNLEVFKRVVKAAKKEAAEMSLDAERMKAACCTEIRVEVKKVWGAYLATDAVKAEMQEIRDFPIIFNVPAQGEGD